MCVYMYIGSNNLYSTLTIMPSCRVLVGGHKCGILRERASRTGVEKTKIENGGKVPASNEPLFHAYGGASVAKCAANNVTQVCGMLYVVCCM
jgi:hypothetical protein